MSERTALAPRPRTSLLYDMCDRTGVLAWVDMPFSRSTLGFLDICYYPTPQFKESGFEMLKEIVYQNFNHPSVVMWGLFNLVWQRGDDVVAYVKELNELAHSLDASRMTVGASNSDGEINFVTDLIVLRQDVGYYKGSVEDVPAFEKKAWHRAQLLPELPQACMSVQFGHIMSGGYAAGYYSYKWAEVLDADAFSLFLQNGIFDRHTASRFRHEVLERGGTEQPMRLYERFRGQKPTIDALLKRNGISKA